MIKWRPLLLCVLPAFLMIMANSCLKKEIEARPSGSISLTLKLQGEATADRVSLSISGSKTGVFEIDQQGICWSESPNPTLADNQINWGTSELSYTQVVEGLVAEKQYYVRAFATEKNEGTTTYSNEIAFKTREASSLSVVTTPVSSISKTGAESGANLTIKGAVAIKSKGLCWNTTTLPTIENFKITAGEGTSSFSGKLDNLSPATRYYLRAYATTEQGETIYGNELVFTTLSPFSMNVVTGEVSEITEMGARVLGSVTGSGEGSIKESGVCWGTQENPLVTGQKKAAGSTGSFSIDLNDLSENTTYYLRAYGISGDNEVVYGKQVLFKTIARATYVLELLEYDNEPSQMRILREIRWGEAITLPNSLAQHFRLKKDGKYITPPFMDNSFNAAASKEDHYLPNFVIYIPHLTIELKFPIKLTLSNLAFRKIVNKVFQIPIPQSTDFLKISFNEQGQCSWARPDYPAWTQLGPFSIALWPYAQTYEHCSSGSIIKKELDGVYQIPTLSYLIPGVGGGGHGMYILKDGTINFYGDVCTNDYPVKEVK